MKRYLGMFTFILLVFVPCWVWGASYHEGQHTTGKVERSSYADRMSISSHNSNPPISLSPVKCEIFVSRYDAGHR